jgi:putative addiction module component (TIGR02574 family)
MSEATKQLIAAVLELPEAERLAVVDAVYESLPKPPGLSEDDPDFDAIIQKRLEDLESGRVVGIDGEQFFKRLREKRAS